MVFIDGSDISTTHGDAQTTAVGGKHPYTKEIRYDAASGELYLRYRYQKDGDDVTYERTIDAKGKSQEERQRIIDKIEKEIGVSKSAK